MARKTKMQIVSEVFKQNLMEGKYIRFFTDGFYGDLLEVKEYIGCVNGIFQTVDKKKRKIELLFDNHQVINSVAFIANDIKVGDFVKVIGFFYDGFYNIQFYCKGINKIITNAKELENFNESTCYEMGLPINLSKVEAPCIYEKSDNFIKLDGMEDYYYIDNDVIQNETQII